MIYDSAFQFINNLVTKTIHSCFTFRINQKKPFLYLEPIIIRTAGHSHSYVFFKNQNESMLLNSKNDL